MLHQVYSVSVGWEEEYIYILFCLQLVICNSANYMQPLRVSHFGTKGEDTVLKEILKTSLSCGFKVKVLSMRVQLTNGATQKEGKCPKTSSSVLLFFRGCEEKVPGVRG